MSEKLTRIDLPGTQGLMDWGEKTAAEMIAQYRAYAARRYSEAKLVLDAPDSAFQIDVVRGPLVQHHVRCVQKGIPNERR